MNWEFHREQLSLMALRTKEQCWRGDVKLSLDFELEHNYLRIFGGLVCDP